MKFIRETSDKVADVIISMANINFLKGETLLEPSAGKGKLIDRLKEIYSFNNDELHIDCVELNKENCEILRSKGYNTYQQDFLQFKPDKKYSRIIACPPFKDNIDLEHIQYMYELLKGKKNNEDSCGIMITLTSPFWTINNEPKHIKFREWLQNKDYYFKMLPDNSFIEKERTQPTGILKIVKK